MNNQSGAEYFNLEKFKIIKSSCNVFDLFKIEAICILYRKPSLCTQKDFDLSVALFKSCCINHHKHKDQLSNKLFWGYIVLFLLEENVLQHLNYLYKYNLHY